MQEQPIEENIISDDEKDFKSKKKVYNLTYYNKHKSQILEKLKEKRECPFCDKVVALSNLSRHRKNCKNKPKP